MPPRTAPSATPGAWQIQKDTAVVLCLALISAIVSVHYDVFERLSALTTRHEAWELDELFSVVIISSVSVIVLAVLRGRRLRREILLREASEEVASALARHDPLTGLPNRRLLAEQLGQAQGRALGSGRELAVLLIDLDRFKPVNDLHGHSAGDHVLTEVARRLHKLVAGLSGSILARLGGDEFACLLDYESGTDAPVRLASQIVHLAASPIAFGVHRIEVGASVGIATCRGTALDVEELLRRADVAMYRAKRDGRSTFRSYEEEMDAELQDQAQLEADLRSGLARGEVVPFYQPIVALPDQAVVGFEALARWVHPERGLLMPDTFIPIAEDCGLIDDLCCAILDAACSDAREWPAHLTLSINISPAQLQNAWLPQRLLQIVTERGFAPGRLVVELTESGIVHDLEAARTIIASLKHAGAKVALDDFGTGYSSLSHLRELQFDSIKIDRSFVRDMDASRDGELVKAIISMGHSLGLPVTAEGVETEGDLSTLIDLHCNHVQGFLLGRPTSAEGALRLLSEAQSRDSDRRTSGGA